MKEKIMEIPSEICIVLQGPIEHTDLIIQHYTKFSKNLIISTNKYNTEDIIKLRNVGFTVKCNNLASHPGRKNFNNQVVNTYEGCKWAKENGFKFVIKMRTDLFFSNLKKLLLEMDKTNVYFSAYHNHVGGYLCDYMVSGEVDYMMALWDIPESVLDIAPEVQMTKRFDKIRNGEIVSYIFPILYEHDIDVWWPKYKLNLKDIKTDKSYSYEDY